MEFGALFLGIEPLAVLAVGVGAIILAPVVNAVGSVAKNTELSESLSESTKEIAKNSLVWGFETFEQAQTMFAQAEESFRDLMADAKTEHMTKKAESVKHHNVEIISE